MIKIVTYTENKLWTWLDNVLKTKKSSSFTFNNKDNQEFTCFIEYIFWKYILTITNNWQKLKQQFSTKSWLRESLVTFMKKQHFKEQNVNIDTVMNTFTWDIVDLDFDNLWWFDDDSQQTEFLKIQQEYLKRSKKNVKCYLNKIPKEYWNQQIIFNELQKDPHTLKYIENPTEEVQLFAVKRNGYVIKYIENPSKEVQLEAFISVPELFNYNILDLTPEMKLQAVKSNGYTLKYIKNPSQEMQLEAVKQNCFAIQFINNPSREMQLEAVKQYPDAIKYIKNPTDEVREFVTNKRTNFSPELLDALYLSWFF